jgi:hypothetical protein
VITLLGRLWISHLRPQESLQFELRTEILVLTLIPP